MPCVPCDRRLRGVFSEERALVVLERHRCWNWTVVLGLLAVLLMAGCARAALYRRVSLTPLVVELLTPSSTREGEEKVLRVAVAAILSPETTSHDYGHLLDTLANRSGRPVELVQRGTYAETNKLLHTGQVDVAFVCTGAYVQGQDDFGMELVAIPEVRGQITYRSHIFVPAHSSAEGLDDLRSQVFAFRDPMSLSGYLVPLHLLQSNGESSEAFFSRTLFTYSHENSVQAAAEGWVDGAAVDGLVYEAMLAHEPIDAESTCVVWRSDPYGMSPVVVSPDLDASTKDMLRRLLLQMDQDAEGQTVLGLMDIDRFVLADDRLYDSARVVLDTVGGAR